MISVACSPVYEGLSLDKSTPQVYRIKGKFSEADVLNGNERIYRGPILSREVNKLQPKIKDRQLLGELDHPADRIEISPAEAAILITYLEYRPSGEVYGEAEVLDTPKGKIVKCLYDAGVKLGISSRGWFPEDSDYVYENGNCYLPDDFCLETFDIVLEPSCFGAYPIKESMKKQIRKLVSESKDLSSSFKNSLNNLLNDKKEKYVVFNFESLKSAFLAKDSLESKFAVRTKRIGKQLKVFINDESFGFNILANKLNSFIQMNSGIKDYKFIIPDEFSLIKKEDKVLDTTSSNEAKLTDNATIEEQKALIASLESKKAFLIKLVASYSGDFNRIKESLAKGFGFPAEDLNTADDILRAFKKIRRQNAVKAAKEGCVKKSVASLVKSCVASKHQTTCSERVISNLRDKISIHEGQVHDLVKLNLSLKTNLQKKTTALENAKNGITDLVKDSVKQQAAKRQAVKRRTFRVSSEKVSQTNVVPKRKKVFWQPKENELFSSKAGSLASKVVNVSETIYKPEIEAPKKKDAKQVEMASLIFDRLC